MLNWLKNIIKKERKKQTTTTGIPELKPLEENTTNSQTKSNNKTKEKELNSPQKKKKEKLIENKPIANEALVKSELNLEKNKIFTVSTFKGRSREIKDNEGLKITVGKMPDGTETGILTTNHFKIYLALVELWELAGKPINEPVRFTTYKLIKRLSLSDSGGQVYERLKRWVRDLRFIPITFIQSFYDKETGKYINLTDISILNHLRLTERKIGKAKKTRGYGEFQFDRYILQNLIGNHVHPLRLDVIKSFKSHKDTAILLYVFLDRNLAFKKYFEITLTNLFDSLDLSQNQIRYPADRKFIIDPVLNEVRNKALSTGILTKLEIIKTKDETDYKLTARKFPFKFESILPVESSESKDTNDITDDEDQTVSEAIKQEKQAMDENSRKELREQAIEELRNTPGVREEFITDALIEVKENEILKRKLDDI